MNTPTAKEFLEYRTPTGISNVYSDYWDAMIDFAQLHVEAALKAAAEKAEVGSKETKEYVFIGFGTGRLPNYFHFVKSESILTAYPPSNIK